MGLREAAGGPQRSGVRPHCPRGEAGEYPSRGYRVDVRCAQLPSVLAEAKRKDCVVRGLRHTPLTSAHVIACGPRSWTPACASDTHDLKEALLVSRCKPCLRNSAGFREQRPHHPRLGPRLGLLPDAGVLRRVVVERLQRQAGLWLLGQCGQGLGRLARG